MARKVCMVTDLLSEPFDEGMNIFSLHLARGLAARFDFTALTNSRTPPGETWIRTVSFGKMMLSSSLRAALRETAPEDLIYLPQAAITDNSLFRSWVLRRMAPRSRLHVIGLQPRILGLHGRSIASHCRAQFYVQSRASASQLQRVGLSAAVLPSGVDVRQFLPASAAEKRALRMKHGVDPAACLISHVGHLKASRNPAWFERVAGIPGVRLLVKASSLRGQDAQIRIALEALGATVWTHNIDSIEEVYRMSDAYLFPVTDPRGAIEWPLSVLEALACGVPVIATRFGGLADLPESGTGIVFASNAEELPSTVERVRGDPALADQARRTAEAFSWEHVINSLTESFSR